jgi:signal transduction histidine kinase
MKDATANNLEMRVPVLTYAPKDSELTAEILKRSGIDCVICRDLGDLCDKLIEGAGAALVVEEALSVEPDDILCTYIAEQPSWSDLPVLVLAAGGADSPRIANAMDRLGNVTVLERPIRIAALVSAVRSALRARSRQYQVREDAKALREARDQLEVRVQERTAELTTTNSILEQKISEVEAAEKRSQLLLRELVSAQENERARIARDLHDELGQQLTGLRLHLAQIEKGLPKKSPARDMLSLSEREAEKIDTHVSFLSWMIRPTMIEEIGLPKALEGYIREWSRNFNTPIEFKSAKPPSERLLAEIEINIYRIAQECLNNIAKYAEATKVAVLLSITTSETTLIVEDNGKGFDPSGETERSSRGGLGIRGMRERAELLEGEFQIESSPAAGTTVYVRIPSRFRPKPAAFST